MWEWLKKLYHQTGSPRFFYEKTGAWLPWLILACALFLVVGVVWALLFVPVDYQQGNSVRIMYIHVPSAILAQSVYMLMALASAVSMIWKIKVADMVAKSCAVFGASITALALLTGAIWGKPTWGTYWVWDARLTSMLLLFFLYVGVIALRASIENINTAGRAAGMLSIVGVVNIPIIKDSVEWWNSLHQAASFTLTEKPAMPPEMWQPLLVCVIGFYLLFTVVVIQQTRNEILVRESKSQWVRKMMTSQAEIKWLLKILKIFFKWAGMVLLYGLPTVVFYCA